MSYHIRDVLKSVQEAAPAPHTTTDDIIARAGRIRTRRAMTAVAGGVVACLALTTVVVTGLGATNGQPAAAPPVASQPVPSASAPAPILKGAPIQPAGFGTRLAEYRVGEYRIGPAGQVAPGYQKIPVYRDGQTWQDDNGTKYPFVAGTITVYRPGLDLRLAGRPAAPLCPGGAGLAVRQRRLGHVPARLHHRRPAAR